MAEAAAEHVRRLFFRLLKIWALYNLWHAFLLLLWACNVHAPIGKVLKNLADDHLLPLLILLPQGIRIPCWLPDLLICLGITFTLTHIVAGPPLCFFGFRWYWAAAGTWALALGVALAARSIHKGCLALRDLCDAYACVLIASVLYEVPWLIRLGKLIVALTKPKFLFTAASAYVLIRLHKLDWRPLLPLLLLPLYWWLCIPFWGAFLVRMPFIWFACCLAMCTDPDM